MSNLRRYIPNSSDLIPVVLVAAALVLLYVALMGWPSWVPWSAERKVPGLEAQVADLTDEKLVGSRQSDLDRDIAQATQSTLTIRLQEQARTDAYVRKIEAAPDAGARRDALLEFVCGSKLYADDPTCVHGAEDTSLSD